MRPLLSLAALTSAGAAPALAADLLPVCPVQNGQVAEYDLVRGGNVIGRQTVRYAVNGSDMTVTVDVQAALHALGITVYRYQHHGEERWHGGQMVALATRRFDLSGPVSGSAWYDRNGCWLQALFNTRVDGSRVEVRARNASGAG